MGKKVKKDSDPPPKDVFDPLIIESKKTGTVALMLKSDEEEVLVKACEAIYRFADKCDENKLMLLELGVIESIIRLICHEDKPIKRFACMAFGVMAGHPEVRKYLRQTEAIPAAIQLLGDEDDVCNEFSSLFLSHMSNDFASKLAISKAEGLEPLINLLASPDPDVQKNSIQALYNLVQDFQSRANVCEFGAIPYLMEMLKSDYAVIQELALNTLRYLTLDVDSRAALREQEGLEQLVNFLGNKEFEDLHVNCLAVLSNCLEDTESLDDIRATGGMDKLLGFATEYGASHDVQTHTARAIARSARSVENSKVLHEQEVEKTLITLCGSDNDSVRVAACHAIAALADNLASKDTFGKSEGIPPLINLLSADDLLVREAASLALANLTLTHTNNCREVVAAGGIEQLLAALQSTKESIIVNSAACLINMSHDFNIRTDILKSGIISSLTEPLKAECPGVQSKISQVVAAYVTDAEARAEMRLHSGLAPLIQLLHSNDKDVRRNAAWAIMVCSADEPTAIAILKLGGLEILQEINDSDQRRSNYSIAALDKLLDSNLPAKYSLTGHLAPHNIITDGFYDAGQLRPNAKFSLLEELAKNEIDQRRPVIVVNCKVSDAEVDQESTSDLELEVFELEHLHEHETDLKVSRVRSPGSLSSRERHGDDRRPRVKVSHEETSEKGSRVSSKASHSRRKKKDKEAQMKEEAERLRLEREAFLKEQLEAELKKQEETKDTAYRPPADTTLQGYIDDVIKFIQPLATTNEQIVALAQFVVDKMGGEIERGKLMDFSWELHIAELKCDCKSNIIPIGKIHRGIHYHRALLYKVLADRIGVPCSLVRGKYNRAWNEVMIAASLDKGAPRYPPTKYIVDLIHECGRLIRSDMPEAIQYQSI